jgi:hypothetical protein
MSQPSVRLRPYLTGLFAASVLAGCAASDAKPDSESSAICAEDSEECDDTPSVTPSDDDDDDDDDVKPGKTDSGTPRADTGTGNNPKMEPATGDLACESQRIVNTYCSDCHGAKPVGAPMSLTMASHYQAAAKDGRKMHAVIKERINESDPKKVMPPGGYDEPTAAELAKLNAWLEMGAPASTKECDTSTPTADAGATPMGDPGYVPPKDSELECFKLVAHSGDLKTPYSVGVASDAYFNFTFAAPWKSMAYGIAFKPIIDNADVIHHWLLFQDDVPGIPNSVTGSIGAHPVGQLLTGWAPGGDTVDFRDSKADVGLELPGDGTTYTMEYHYNSSDIAAKDASGVEVCVTRKKPKHVAGLSWLGYDQLLIPAEKWTGTCSPLAQEPIHILSVTPHMHVQGRHMKAVINRKDGAKETLHDLKFDFDFQKSYNKSAVLMPGDSITTECTFAKPMSFGTQTDAEMCYLFTMAYPKGALKGLDLWGTFAHGGSSCLGM